MNSVNRQVEKDLLILFPTPLLIHSFTNLPVIDGSFGLEIFQSAVGECEGDDLHCPRSRMRHNIAVPAVGYFQPCFLYGCSEVLSHVREEEFL